MANKKGSDGRYRYRVCIGKDETGKPKYKKLLWFHRKGSACCCRSLPHSTGQGNGSRPIQSHSCHFVR